MSVKTEKVQPGAGKATGMFETIAFAKKRAKTRKRNKQAKAARRKNRR